MNYLERITATSCIIGCILVVVGCVGMWLFGTGLAFLIAAIMWVIGASALFAALIGAMFAVLVYIWRIK